MNTDAQNLMDEKVWLALNHGTPERDPRWWAEATYPEEEGHEALHQSAEGAATAFLSMATLQGTSQVKELMDVEGLTIGQVLDSLVRTLHHRGGLPTLAD